MVQSSRTRVPIFPPSSNSRSCWQGPFPLPYGNIDWHVCGRSFEFVTGTAAQIRYLIILSGLPVKILLDEDALRQGVCRLADQVNEQYDGCPLTIIGVLTGSVVLLADLIRKLDMPLRVGVVQASSYRGGTRRGELAIQADFMPDIRDRHVLLVDDIFDTGHTLANVVELVRALHPASLGTLVLLRKSDRQEVEYEPDFVGFEIPDAFVVGYGLDYADAYRNLNYLAALEPEDLTSPT